MRQLILPLALSAAVAPALAATCEATSRPQLVPVIELYTSEGCSSCPPADRWLSGLKRAAAEGRVVAQAFHIGYWDQLGWADRFALAAGTERQKQLASVNHLGTIYTPQLVRNGQDWRDYDAALLTRGEPAKARIHLAQSVVGEVQAEIEPGDDRQRWSAYWTVTEHGHASKVKAGENAGEVLQHDFVVRQYVTTAAFTGAQKLTLRTVPKQGDAPRAVNLVVVDPATQKPLQAVSLQCAG
ncbi:DUF1223 domain-containing protein [Ramlibacter algicola]|uniref:DUF1223 domain-containing protein n=1 Tax=Ramlibacter algicola TaxID=2795217 RepID=A0A934PYM1_9BURK|nr:DUF1223 domain-containing protein [Ramlibacter algicola]MBK0391457.1 DUF1223 domain-containing protein [Ramlibacter algicola]